MIIHVQSLANFNYKNKNLIHLQKYSSFITRAQKFF